MTYRRCLREPIPEILEAARYLSQAVDAHLTGDRAAASRLFTAANMPAVREWTESLWGRRTPAIHGSARVPSTADKIAIDQRSGQRMPNSSEQAALILRYGYRCAFCGIPVIRDTVRRRVTAEYPDAVPWGSTNATQHAAFQAMWLQFDHVVPHARGGSSDIENVVVTCAPCNFGRGDNTLAEMELADPRALPVPLIDWDGLERFLKPL